PGKMTTNAQTPPPTQAGGGGALSIEAGPYRGKPPGPYVPGSDWRIWLRQFSNFLTLRDVSDDKKKVLIFLNDVGAENYSILESLLPGEELEKLTYEKLTSTLTAKYKPKVLLLGERHRLVRMEQKPEQSLAEFYASLQNAAKTCEFA